MVRTPAQRYLMYECHGLSPLMMADRTTAIGQMINSYLQKGVEIDDRCVHLLFSANRWESE